MSNGWSIQTLLSELHDDIQEQLARARKAFGHPGTKGDASEAVWLELLQTYLPARYQAASAHVVDSAGAGDTFLAAFVAARRAGQGVGDALSSAARAAAITVSRRGTSSAFPTRPELAACLAPAGATA